MICQICGKEYSDRGLSSHLRHAHSLSCEEYYRQFNTNTYCPICGKLTKFINLQKGFANTCGSMHCGRVNGSKKTREIYGYIPGSYGSKEFKQSMIDKYGAENPQQNKEIRARTIETTKTNLGVDYAFLTKEAKQKAKINSHSKETTEKTKKTNLKRYGKTNPAKSDIVKQKIKNTIFNKHLINFSKTRLDLSMKEIKTKGSKIEQLFYNKLSDFTILYNACSDDYPYLCDFYIKEFDLYIELNITWTHFNHYYNKTLDKNILDQLIHKSNNYYNGAIHTWTSKDIEKRDCAIKNNLNFVVVWNNRQIEQLIKDIYSNKHLSGFIDYNDLENEYEQD